MKKVGNQSFFVGEMDRKQKKLTLAKQNTTDNALRNSWKKPNDKERSYNGQVRMH